MSLKKEMIISKSMKTIHFCRSFSFFDFWKDVIINNIIIDNDYHHYYWWLVSFLELPPDSGVL